jgi:hypothetical protein
MFVLKRSPIALTTEAVGAVEANISLTEEEKKNVAFDLRQDLCNDVDIVEWREELIKNLNAADEGYSVLTVEEEAVIRLITVPQATKMFEQITRANSMVVDFTVISSAVLRSNEAMYFLGSTGQCIAVFMYLVKYMTKDANQLNEMIVLIANAKKTVQRFPGVPRDGESSDLRDLKKFAARLLNHSEGGMREMADTTIAFANIGGKKYFSRIFIFIYNLTKKINNMS